MIGFFQLSLGFGHLKETFRFHVNTPLPTHNRPLDQLMAGEK